jgi:hypothetical protein
VYQPGLLFGEFCGHPGRWPLLQVAVAVAVAVFSFLVRFNIF